MKKAAIGLFFGLTFLGIAQPSLPLTAKQLLPAAPVYSGDRAIVVYASTAMAGYRAPVMMFADRVRAEFLRTARITLAPQSFNLAIVIGNQRDGDSRVVAVRQRIEGGEVRERIELPDPEHADLTLFRAAIRAAILRSWMASVARNESMLACLPKWLIPGWIRRLDPVRWQADVDRVVLLWSRACLPPVAELLAEESPAILREPAIGAVLADYLTEKKTGVSVLERFLTVTQVSPEWRVQSLSRMAIGDVDVARLDEQWDAWLMAKGRRISAPGETRQGVVRLFRSGLLLYPSDYGTVFNPDQPWLTLQEVLERGNDPTIRRPAAGQIAGVVSSAAGRDGTLLAVADDYVRFLKSVAEGEKRDVMEKLLERAESRRKQMEQAVAGDRVLKDSKE